MNELKDDFPTVFESAATSKLNDANTCRRYSMVGTRACPSSRISSMCNSQAQSAWRVAAATPRFALAMLRVVAVVLRIVVPLLAVFIEYMFQK